MNERDCRLLKDIAWSQIGPAVAKVRPMRGRKAQCDRRFLDAVRWILRTGAPWRDLPKAFGPWQTSYGRFSRWAKAGLWARLYEALGGGKQATLTARDVFGLDSTSIRLHQHGAPKQEQAASEQLGISRAGRTTKLHVACSTSRSGVLQASKAVLSPGNRHDLVAATALTDSLPAGALIVADKAYDAGWFRLRLRRGQVRSVVPKRGQGTFRSKMHSAVYRRRNEVERLFARLKQFRRIASRYERRAVYFGGFVLVALGLSSVSASALPR